MTHQLFVQLSNSIRYSFDGLKFLLRNEFAARLEFYGLVWGILLCTYLQVSVFNLVIAFILFCILVAIEALNTAIEVVIDRISPEISQTGKHAKDLGSFAVLCILTANFVFLAYIIWQSDLPAALARLQSSFLFAIMAVIFIMSGIYLFARAIKTIAMPAAKDGV